MIRCRLNFLYLLSLSCLAIAISGCDQKAIQSVDSQDSAVFQQDDPKTAATPSETDKASGTEVTPITPTVESGNEKPSVLNGSQESSVETPSTRRIVSTEKSAEVNHNDPTSYPVTKLATKGPEQIAFFSWNVESDGANPDVVAAKLKEFNQTNRYDVLALTEVMPGDLKKYHAALGWDYRYAFTKSGFNDRMQIIYNVKRFEEVRHFELNDINPGKRYRAPLVVHLKEKTTGRDFLVMVNHLARGKADLRQTQANQLVEWAREQTLPVIALGDYNFDYVFATEQGNEAFTNFMRDNIWLWLKPEEWVDTNWYDNPESPDGKDDYPGSMLDFAFAAGPAKQWINSCTVIVTRNDFPDNEETSDHRPYEVLSTPN